MFVAAAGWSAVSGAVTGILVLEHRLRHVGRGDLAMLASNDGYVFVVAIASAATVGAALAVRRPRHPVGWLFLALGMAIAVSGLVDAYAAYGVLARPGSLPIAKVAAVYGRASFIPWLVLLCFILLLTPTGRPPSPRWVWVARTSVLSGVVLLGASMISTRALDSPFQAVRNPWAVPALAGATTIVGLVGDVGIIGAVLAGVASLVVRFRRAAGDERLQLRWITLAAAPVPFLVVGTAVASATGHRFVLTLLAGALVVVLPVGAAASIMRYHLYDVDRLFSRTVTYLVLSAVVVVSYAAVVIAVGGSLGYGGGQTQLSAVLGTLVAVSVALPARRWLQQHLDRRFNRRHFEAVQVVRVHAHDPHPGRTVEDVLRQALDDPSLTVAYWIEDRARWVTSAGRPAAHDEGNLDIDRHGVPMASVNFDPRHVERRLVSACAAEARPELENERLRASIALQLVEVRESRERIVAAQLAERHRIERNLHDGAQQRLLALAFQLRAAEASPDHDRTRAALSEGVSEIQCALGELRELANGLHPTILTDGGLAAALEDLVQRTPISVRLTATDDRFSPNTEAAAWFIASEALTNAVKHAQATTVEVRASRQNNHLVLVVDDDGRGGAQATGQGLRGIADRADAAGGRLTIADRVGGGTSIRVELPCES